MRKPARGRYFIALSHNGCNFYVESVKDRSLSTQEVVDGLRKYADFIEEHFLRDRSGSATAVPAVESVVEESNP